MQGGGDIASSNMPTLNGNTSGPDVVVISKHQTSGLWIAEENWPMTMTQLATIAVEAQTTINSVSALVSSGLKKVIYGKCAECPFFSL